MGTPDVGTPGTIRIHAEGGGLPAPADGMWSGVEEEPGEFGCFVRYEREIDNGYGVWCGGVLVQA